MRFRVALCGLLLGCVSLAGAADWPQWRNDRTGISQEKGLLQKWPAKGPALLWTFRDAGLGFSSFAIVKDTLYTLGADGKVEFVIALDVKDKPKKLWSSKIGPIFTFDNNSWGEGPRGTPTIDGNLLYAIGGQGILVCVDITSGKEVWRKDFVGEMGGQMMTEWGYSESPLVNGNLVVCAPGGKDGAIAAFDKSSGKLMWQTKDLKHKATYGSAVIANINGIKQYIHTTMVSEKAGAAIHGLAAADGKILWSAPIFEGSSYSACATPIVIGNKVYATTLSESPSGCHLFEIGPDFKATDLYPKSAHKNMKNNHGGVVLVDGHIYGHSNGWVCQDMKTGKVKWDERQAIDGSSGAIIAADGCLYILSELGEVVLLEATSKEFNELGRFPLPEKAKAVATAPRRAIWAHPAIVDGKLYLRDQELIFCYDIRAK